MSSSTAIENFLCMPQILDCRKSKSGKSGSGREYPPEKSSRFRVWKSIAKCRKKSHHDPQIPRTGLCILGATGLMLFLKL